MGQILADEHDLRLPCSTLTRLVREAELRAASKRAGEYDFVPGEEMQHHTSPHRLEVAGKAVTAQCAGLTLAYARRPFIQYYPRYTASRPSTFFCRRRSSWMAPALAASSTTPASCWPAAPGPTPRVLTRHREPGNGHDPNPELLDEEGGGAALPVRGSRDQQARSKIRAMPSQPSMHIVTRAQRRQGDILQRTAEAANGGPHCADGMVFSLVHRMLGSAAWASQRPRASSGGECGGSASAPGQPF